MPRRSNALLAAAMLLCLSTAHAQRPEPPQGPLISGYLCCNMRTTGAKITDINYDETGKKMLAAGTLVQITNYELRAIQVNILGTSQRIMNDYSRELNMTAFAQRYVVTEDPRVKLATYPEKIRHAIEKSKVIPGMSREQVVMAMGYPVTSENPSFDAATWNFWLDSWTAFYVEFDKDGLVERVQADAPTTLTRVTETEN